MTMYQRPDAMVKTFRNIRRGLLARASNRVGELDCKVRWYADGYVAEDENFDKARFLRLCGVENTSD